MSEQKYVGDDYETAFIEVSKDMSDKEFRTLRARALQSARSQLSATGGNTQCDNMLEDLHSDAWITILKNPPEKVSGVFIANKMVWLYKDHWRRGKAEKRWLEEYARGQEDKRHVRS